MPRYQFAVDGAKTAAEIEWLPDDVTALKVAAEVSSDLGRNNWAGAPVVIATRLSSSPPSRPETPLNSVCPTTDDRTAGEISRRMNKINEHQRDREICEVNAANAPSQELGDAWRTIAKSYVVLIELESRPQDGLSTR